MSTDGNSEPATAPVENADQAAGGASGAGGAQGVWADIEKAYAVEYDHSLRLSELNIHNAMAAVGIFQSQMLGLFALGEAEIGLVPGGDTLDAPAALAAPAAPVTPTSEVGGEPAIAADPTLASV